MLIYKRLLSKNTLSLKLVLLKNIFLWIPHIRPWLLKLAWIRKGKEKQIRQTASRTRENIIGGIDLNDLNVVTTYNDTVNSESIITFFKKLKETYTTATTLHIILDQAGYHRTEEVRKFAQENAIELHYLPPYSPNLNPIERLWKFMMKK